MQRSGQRRRSPSGGRYDCPLILFDCNPRSFGRTPGVWLKQLCCCCTGSVS